MSYELNFLLALFCTVTIETLSILFFLRVFFREKKFSAQEVLYAGVLPSLATLPYVWFLFPYFLRDHQIYTISVESFAVIVESFLIGFILKIGLKRGAWLSLGANAASFLAGFLVFPSQWA